MQLPKFTSPTGKLGFPCAIVEPDTKFACATDPDDHGDFKARLILPKDSAEGGYFRDQLETVWEKFCEEVRQETGKKKLKIDPDLVPWSDEVDRETEEPTGNWVFRAKLQARVKKRAGGYFDQKPQVFGTDNVLLQHAPNIGPGSKVRLAGEIRCWRNESKMGMTLRLKGVQLIELVERGSNMSAEGYGFATTEGFTDLEAAADVSDLTIRSAPNNTTGGDF